MTKWGNQSNTPNQEKPGKNKNEILSFLKISPMQKGYSPSYKLLDFGYE